MLVTDLLEIEPARFAREAATFVEALPDGERGLLASALTAAYGTEFDGLLALLSLDSADPSLMSRSDLTRLLCHTQGEHPEVLRAALQALHDQPRVIQALGAAHAPTGAASDTSRIAHEEE